MKKTALLVALLPALASAQVPAKLGYQGRLLRADGAGESGVVGLTFSLYGAESGGVPLWTESQSLGLADGFYATGLGETKPLPPGVFSGEDRFLEVSVGGGGALAPRQRLSSVPYALRAGVAHDLVGGVVDASAIKVGGQTVIDAQGRLAGSATYTAGSGLTLAGGEFALKSCQAGQVLKWDGATWACAGANYAAGDGLSLAGTTFALRGCADGQILKYGAGGWACATDAVNPGTLTAVTATAPLLSSGGSAPNLSLASDGCIDGQVLKLTKSGWACAKDEGVIYEAGAGLKLTGTTFSVDSASCQAGQALKWSGSAWACATESGGAGYVQNQSAAPQSASFHISGSGTLGGNLAVGTSVPAGKLHVAGSVDANATGVASASAASATLSGVGTLFLSEVAPGDTVTTKPGCTGAGQSRVVTVVAGNTSLTVASPWSETLINCSLELKKVTPSLVVGAQGRVGVGTASPQTALHVVGDLRVDGLGGRAIFHRLFPASWLNANAQKLDTHAYATERLDFTCSATYRKFLEVPLIPAGRLSATRSYFARVEVWMEPLTSDNDPLFALSDGADIVGFMKHDAANAVIGIAYQAADGTTATFGAQIGPAGGAVSSTFRYLEVNLLLGPSSTFVLGRSESLAAPVHGTATRVVNADQGLRLVAFCNDPTERYGIYSVRVEIFEESP